MRVRSEVADRFCGVVLLFRRAELGRPRGDPLALGRRRGLRIADLWSSGASSDLWNRWIWRTGTEPGKPRVSCFPVFQILSLRPCFHRSRRDSAPVSPMPTLLVRGMPSEVSCRATSNRCPKARASAGAPFLGSLENLAARTTKLLASGFCERVLRPRIRGNVEAVRLFREESFARAADDLHGSWRGALQDKTFGLEINGWRLGAFCVVVPFLGAWNRSPKPV